MSLNRFLLVLSCALSLVFGGCDDTPTADAGTGDGGPPDAGPPDAGPPDAGPPLACSETMAVEGVLDDTVTVMFDTSMTETRPRDLGIACGNVEGELRWAPQEVIELTVPGTGQVAVELDTVFEGTDEDFNTVLQVREACEMVPQGTFPPTCFNNVDQTELRSRGAFMAEGGSTVFIIVTGFSEPPAAQGTVDEGRVEVAITVRANTAPTATTGSLQLVGDDALISATGMDPDADALGVALNFYDASGALLDIYGDGEATLDGDLFPVLFDPPTTTTDFTGSVTVPGTQVNLAAYLRAVAVGGQAGIRVFDSAYAMSEMVMVDIIDGEIVGFGEACDDTHICRAPELACVSGVCDASPAVAAACTGATALTLHSTTLSASASGNIPVTTPGDFAPSLTCIADPMAVADAEDVYTVTIPTGTTADLLATTDVAGTPEETDTIVYVRGTCADSESELACADDVDTSGMIFQSAVEVPDLTEGTYFVFVETYEGSGGDYQLDVRLRPVLATGASCDPAGELNRCASGTCDSTSMLCP